MAVPTLSSVSPTQGPTGGEILVELVGTNFRLPPAPPAAGPVPTPDFSPIEVLFGSTPATRADPLTDSLAIARLPRHDPGAVDVTLRNLDDAGVPIPGETATLADAFTFERPRISGGESSDGRIQNVTKRLILELRRQIIEEVVHAPHVDWTDSPDDVLRETRIARLPALLLVGPRGALNRFYRSSERRRKYVSDSEVLLRRAPSTMDLEFDVGIVSDHKGQTLRLMELCAQFFHRTPWLYADEDPTDTSSGNEVRYELDLTSAPSMGAAPSDSNVRDAVMTCVVRGVDVGLIPGVPDDLVVDRTTVLEDPPTLDIQQADE